MNELGLIGKFWEYNEKESLGAVAAALYLFLLEIFLSVGFRSVWKNYWSLWKEFL